MKIGIISFAHMHAHSYAKSMSQIDHIEFVGIYDDQEERGKHIAEIYKVPFFNSLETFLNQNMDAVIITSENSKHYYYVEQSSKKNKDILCEKPLATTEEDAKAIIEVCEKYDVKLQTAFPVRYATPIRQAKRTLDNGQIGRILAVKATNRGKNPGGWFLDKSLSGGGAVLDHTVHVTDILRWFIQSEVKEVYGEVGTMFTDQPIDDTGILTMEFNNGVFASLDCSWSRADNYPHNIDVMLEIVGSKGNMKVNVFSQGIFVYSDIYGVSHEFFGDDMDQEMIYDFSTSTRPFVTGNDGLKALEVALAAYKSSEKKQPVMLDENNKNTYSS